MGIDVYLKWNEMKKEDHEAQLGTGFQTNIGDTGYLREAYHGEPYATQMLVPEAFDDKLAGEDVPIFAKEMRARLPKVLEKVRERYEKIYEAGEDEIKEAQKSFSDFVKLAEQKEDELKEPCKVYASY
jgi:hypothetical protein